MKPGAEIVNTDMEHVVRNAQNELAALAGDRVLVTGGAGFLGYYLVQALLHWNRHHPGCPIEVVLADNFQRGEPRWVAPLQDHPHCRVIPWDVRQPWPADLPPCPWVVHAASIASPTYYRKWPIETIEANVVGLLTLLHRCRVARDEGSPLEGFLFFSSSEVYGDPDPAHIPTPETYHGNVSCTGPRACYDEAKRLGETICVSFAQQHGLRVVSARPFNNYGPGLKISDRRVIPDLVRDILAGEDISLFSDGSPTRTFCYVADAVVGYLKVLVRGKKGEAYNIGTTGPEISMFALGEKLANLGNELLGYGGRVLRARHPDHEYLTDNPNRRRPDIEKAVRELEYAPVISLDEGLRRTLLWYADNRHGEDA